MFIKNFIKEIGDSVGVEVTIQDVVDTMSKNKFHHIVIVQDKKPVGILTESDIVKLFKEDVDFNLQAVKFATTSLITLHNTRLAQHALSMMVDHSIRRIVVLNSKDEYSGCVEQENIIFRFEEELSETNVNIHQLLDASNKAVIIDENSTLKQTLSVMIKKNLTSILVSRDDIPIGIVSESDILHLAQQHIEQNKSISEFIHTSIIKVNASTTITDVIHIMKENDIRRMVVYDDQFDEYHILNSKTLVSALKGNYTKFLESKLFDVRDTFNGISEYVVELLDLEEEQAIYWTNEITKFNFNINIDDNIIKMIPKIIWDDLLEELISSRILHRVINIDDRYYNVRGHYGTILNDNIIKLFLNDITEVTKLNMELKLQNQYQEKLLYDQSKMVQMGEMIGNITHQWRQPLNAISISASGMLLEKEYNILENDKLVTYCDSIINHSEYLSNTIDVFKDFLKEKKELKDLIVQDRLDTVLKIVSPSLKSNHIKIINNIDYTKLINIKMVAGELDQVVINIINNAKDILSNIGKQNNTNQDKVIDPWIQIDLQETKDKVTITIEDNGGGIPSNIIDNIFDKYFTTKDNSNGTGLGLHMSNQIVKDSLKGDFYVKNTNHGAKFFIEIPI